MVDCSGWLLGCLVGLMNGMDDTSWWADGQDGCKDLSGSKLLWVGWWTESQFSWSYFCFFGNDVVGSESLYEV